MASDIEIAGEANGPKMQESLSPPGYAVVPPCITRFVSFPKCVHAETAGRSMLDRGHPSRNYLLEAFSGVTRTPLGSTVRRRRRRVMTIVHPGTAWSGGWSGSWTERERGGMRRRVALSQGRQNGGAETPLAQALLDSAQITGREVQPILHVQSSRRPPVSTRPPAVILPSLIGSTSAPLKGDANRARR